MKKSLFIILLFISTASYAANVYFEVRTYLPYSNTDVFNNKTYYSNDFGMAQVTFSIYPISQYFYVDQTGARIQYPDGSVSGTLYGYSGGWNLTQEGTYYIQAYAHVVSDWGGETDYFMYSNILTFTVVDNNAPSVPSSLAATFSGTNPVITWSANTEADMETFVISKRVVGETGFAEVATLPATTTQWTDNTVTHPGKFDPNFTIEYKIKAIDMNDNESSYSSTQSVTGYTDYLWKQTSEYAIGEPITSYELFSNYPNPFNPTTNIVYQIPSDGFVNLKVYNSIGREVSELVNEYQTSGRYTIDFNGENLPSGMYIYKIQANEFSSVKKMLLTK